MSGRRAVVVGAGIGGLAAAIALDRIGMDVSVYEQAVELREVGAGLSIWPDALDVLDELGVGEAVRDLAPVEPDAKLYRSDGAVIASMTSTASRVGGGQPRVIHRAQLHELLRDAWGGPIGLGKRCSSVEVGQGRATVQFDEGSEAAADLVVGADGLRSRVREALHGEASPRYAGYLAWRAVVAGAGWHLHPGETWGAGARFGRARLSENRIYWFATKTMPLDTPHDIRKTLSSTFAGWHQPIPQLLDATPDEDILENAIFDRPPLPVWGSGVVALLGDAAHPMTPNLGQGACQALLDASALARRITGDDIESCLRSYEAARKAATARLVRRSRLVGKVGQLRSPAAVGIRNAVLRVL